MNADGEEVVEVWSVEDYECAGLWYDRHFQACLLMRVKWGEDKWSAMVLYARQRKLVNEAITRSLEWAVRDAGRGDLLVKLPAGPVALRSWMHAG